jgi:hypothetical protein
MVEPRRSVLAQHVCYTARHINALLVAPAADSPLSYDALFLLTTSYKS